MNQNFVFVKVQGNTQGNTQEKLFNNVKSQGDTRRNSRFDLRKEGVYKSC